MSRYDVPGRREPWRTVVGWDPPLRTFFAQVFTIANAESPAHWFGAGDRVHTVEELAELIDRWVVLPPEVRNRLEDDRSVDLRSYSHVVHDSTRPDNSNPAFGPMTENEADQLVARNPQAYWKEATWPL